MYTYKISIKRVSGLLKESVLPKKNLVIKSKVERTTRGVLKEAAKYLLENYGLELRDAKVVLENAPRLSSSNQRERQAAMAAQSNHRLTRPNVNLSSIRDAVTRELASVYSQFDTERRDLWYDLPDGITITMDGQVRLYGGHERQYRDSYEDATNGTWENQYYKADEKAADNVFSVQYDPDEDFRSLLWYRNKLGEEISYMDLGDDEEEEFYDRDANATTFWEEETENMKNFLEGLTKFSQLKNALSNFPFDASQNLLEELEGHVMYVMEKYIQMNRKDGHSRFGLWKMENQK